LKKSFSFLAIFALSLPGCSNFIDGMAGLGQLNYDKNGNAYVPQYPDERFVDDIGGGDCTAQVIYGRQNNNSFAQIINKSSRDIEYTIFWSDGSRSPGFASARSSGGEIRNINPNIVPKKTEIECRE